ncbi:hypothetical protein AYO38_04070 [bacterium SCGC AG-212-C10]|nr:hypothetical protein AYO38_04070 [bacterium SCGC AG-212-C10]
MSETSAPPLPTGIQLTSLDPVYREDPHSILDRLRVEDPVHYNELMDSYFLTRYEDVFALLRDRDLSVDPRKIVSKSPITQLRNARFEEGVEPSMLMQDAPEHDRLRNLVNKAFTPRAVDRMGPRIQQVSDELLDAAIARGQFDVIADFSAPLPTIIIAEMLGVDPEDQAQFKVWSDSIVQSFNPFLDEAKKAEVQAAGKAMDDYIRAAIEVRRKDRRDDLITGMIEAEEAGQRLNDQEIVTMVGLLLAAGNLTTTDLIGNGVYALLTNPSELKALQDDPSLIDNAVEEMLRFDPPVQQSGRHPFRDQTIAGCPMHQGQSIGVSLAAANHDPSVHPDPHRFDVRRENIEHVSFGGGRRYCLGANLARLEAKIAVGTLVARCPDIKLATDTVVHRSIPVFRGLTTLPVTV